MKQLYSEVYPDFCEMGIKELKHGRLSIFLCICLAFSACNPVYRPETEQPTSILFIGNSYTFMNDMPDVFAAIGETGGHDLHVATRAKAGYSLKDHAEDQQTREAIQNKNWDYIILQEKSSLPFLNPEMIADGISQVMEITAAQDADLILFLPWAYRAGFPEAGLEDYQAMQSKTGDIYLELGRKFGILVAPVGFAWQSALEQNPALELWSIDGSHPSLLGSYLAADTFYALIFQEPPPEFRTPVTDPADTEVLQILGEIAAETVLETPASWNPRN